MQKVFISHAWEDNAISRKLASYLRRDGAEIWIYYTRNEVDNRLFEFARKAIAGCEAFVLLWSKAAVNSAGVQLEWQNALTLKKTIISCLLDDTKQSNVLRSYLYVNLSNFDNGYSNLAHLLKLNTEAKTFDASAHDTVKGVEFISTPTRFREEPGQISEDDLKMMFAKYNFFDRKRNEQGNGIPKKFDIQELNGNTVLIDQALGVMWQQGGSANSMWYEEAKNWIIELNSSGYAGYQDWRLPTLEEAMSLMERERKDGELYIDPVFSREQLRIWTSDLFTSTSRAWVVFFNYGSCYPNLFDFNNYIRAIRSVK